MKVKPIVSRELAIHDLNEILAYYLGESVMQATYGFIDALEEAYGHIGRHPGTGSQLYAHEELNLPSLRLWPLTRYPHLVFYVERPDHIHVWRGLHGKQDIPAWMSKDVDI